MRDMNMQFLHAGAHYGEPFTGSYDPYLVVLSCLIAVVASTTAFMAGSELRRTPAAGGRRLIFTLGAVTLGIGIWTMHFVAMLALRLAVPTSYDLSVTVISMVPSIAAGVVVLDVISRERAKAAWLAAAGVAVGIGIGAMHYIGMAAMRVDALMVYDLRIAALSVVIAVIMATAALHLMLRIREMPGRRGVPALAGGGAVMGFAAVGMHYSGMWAVSFFPAGHAAARASGLSAEYLGVLVTIATLFIVGVTVAAVLLNHRYSTLRAVATLEARKFEQLLEAIPDGVIGVDDAGRIRFVNAPIEAIFQFERADLIGRPVETLMTGRIWEPDARQRDPHGEAPRGRRMGAGRRVSARRADGTEFPAEINLNQIALPDGPLTICSVRDVSEQTEARVVLEAANQKLIAGMNALKQRSDELRGLTELGELLHGCVTEAEANGIISRLVGKLLPHTVGAVYLLNPSRNLLQSTSTWGGEAASLAPLFAPEDCWALRRGRLYAGRDMSSTVQCNHVNPRHCGYLCVPMLAQGDILGILHVFVPLREDTAQGADEEAGTDSMRLLVIAVAEQIGVALANLRLRAELRSQSIRDPLTGLYNRRFMEEALDRELARASQARCRVSLVAIDLDHFKQLNDSLGHEGGDLVLREIGALLRRHLRGGDLACRFGGEELLIILPETGVDEAAALAEKMRRRIEDLAITLRGQALRKVTASFGVAEYPGHGANQEELLKAADAALYRAKSAGRNQIAVATPVDPGATGSRPAAAFVRGTADE